jgi:hypothetical protein
MQSMNHDAGPLGYGSPRNGFADSRATASDDDDFS